MTVADDMVAALNNHQVTDDSGKVLEEGETSTQKTTAAEETPVDDTATAVKSADEAEEETKPSEADSEKELAEDETGKRYVPESRFKEIYGKDKAKERRIKELEAKLNQLNQTQGLPVNTSLPQTSQSVEKVEALETELLRRTLPQFDPDSESYSEDLDKLGFTIYQANPGITRIEAARRAIGMARKLGAKEAEIKAQARTVKASQSDQGITNRVVSRESTKVDPMKLSLEDKEAWLKAKGVW